MDLSKFGGKHVNQQARLDAAGYLTISTRHSSLHHDRLFALPSVQHRHSSNRRTLLKSNGVDRVVRTDDKRQISIFEVIVDFLHFQHDYSTG